MEAWSSRVRGVGFEAIQEGFSLHRPDNLSCKRSKPIVEGETRTIKNRAIFAARKAEEIPREQIKTGFIDHKVWSA